MSNFYTWLTFTNFALLCWVNCHQTAIRLWNCSGVS